MADRDDLTIEQLAAVADLPFTTIRMYQHRGLLAPPVKRGRVGHYGPDHVRRLALIARLQERGYSLAAIKDLLDTWQDGRSLPDLLGLTRSDGSSVPGAATGELRLRPDELAARFEGVELTASAMARAVALGLVALDGDTVVVPDATFLEVGAALATMGVPVDEILDEYEHLQAVSAELAARFSAVFERNLWAPFVEADTPAEQVPALTDALARLGPLAEQIVAATLRRAMASAAADFLDAQADQLVAPPKRSGRSTATTSPTKAATKPPPRGRR